jgi:hypothetical protein
MIAIRVTIGIDVGAHIVGVPIGDTFNNHLRLEGPEMGEKNQNHQREHPPEDADQQPEVRPAQLKQSVPASTTGRRSAPSLMGETVCSHMAPRRYTPVRFDTATMLMFPERYPAIPRTFRAR